MDISKPQLVIGLGTGRCGTLSLARLLGLQEHCDVGHERYPTLSWYEDPNPCRHLEQSIESLSDVYGDVGMYYLPYVNEIRGRFPGTRFICMKRDREATINSFCRVVPSGVNWFGDVGKHHPFNRCFPNFGDVPFDVGAAMYWDYYYDTAEGLQCDWFRIFPTAALNDERGIEEILRFAGAANPRVIHLHEHEGHR